MVAGYSAVVPASWGDELVARRAVDRVSQCDGPLLLCVCPVVSRRALERDDALTDMVVTLQPPPVATAAYLRAAYAPVRPHIVFAGSCDAGSDSTIDEWLKPAELLQRLAERGITLEAQPREFDSMLSPDRRRHFSEPGGCPSRDALRRIAGAELAELHGDDVAVQIAQQLLSARRVLIDASVPLGCACSGSVAAVRPEAARARVREHEPPRAPGPVVDHDLRITLDAEARAPQSATPAVLLPSDPESAVESTPSVAPVALEVAPRRRSSSGVTRAVLGAMPHARMEGGRPLPRAYVARRRSSPPGVRESGIRREVKRIQITGVVRAWIAAGVLAGLGLAWLLRLLF
jgi:hypothetical protein